jgi:leucyl aminopeptidase
VGKGITFDSGGLSLKTTSGMMTMKDDMGGAAAVISAVAGAAALGLGVRVVGWVAATENMPSGTAIHPGDVLVARNGTSIEVLNTDAEGRLVLADALSLAAEERPDAIVDVATLTGAQVVALGERVAAVFSNDDALADAVMAAGARAGEPAWRLPLVRDYRSKIDSEVADLKNVASGGGAGSIIAGLFLQEFVGDIPWAHLDIAGPSWSDANEGWLTKGGTGWGARTLIQLLAAWGLPA